MKWTFLVSLLSVTAQAAEHVVNQTTCAGTTYKYTGLAGYGFIPSNATDKYGDTIGGIGSSIAIDQSSWHATGLDKYTGIVYTLPDRGWNTNGTLNFQSRIHKFTITLKLAPQASPNNPSPPNIKLTYLDTILLTDPTGAPTTGLDADIIGHARFPGFPPLPVSTYTGNGYGGAGPGGKRVSLDTEGLVLDARDGGFWISDEYGPYIYKFNGHGRMIQAIQPPQAYLPRRNGTVSFNADSPPLYDPSEVPVPVDTESGRDNNQGLEGLTVSSDGRTLYALMQSALDQEGGPGKTTRRPARLLVYDISGRDAGFVGEHVVLLPTYVDYTKKDAAKAVRVAGQSEIHQLGTGDFLVLARDSGFGRGQDESRSVYRHADIFSLKKSTGVTDLKGKKDYDEATGAIASSEGALLDGILPAEYCSFVDYNVNSELGKFRVHNGGPVDEFLLNEKWESLAVVPVSPHSSGSGEKEYFLFSFSDNDFITQDGHMNFGKFNYKDESGYDLDTQVLAFKLKF
ncbi:uncharacterized protein N7511_004545 [Penicillium nucicola]|uniref:uncharacterized protein n=1 Tax=Penicillium nucicola TaxID=1850975 RepID=UPI0025457CF0|nr:uncharacterized protein N7511_004545 [Penicillium nucicola]KAJ5766929.1 hypothetical protein N7511_004545 [Penicillium nucicola]